MELFLLLKNKPDLPADTRQNLLNDFFESDFIFREAGIYNLYLNRKTLAISCIKYTDNTGSAYGTGTFAYRAGNPEESLKFLLDDFTEGRFDEASLLGHYFIFLFRPSGLTILNDGSGLVKSYHDSTGTFLASSFLLASGIAARVRGSLSLNRAAATENIVTGGITGNETLVNEITSFSKVSTSLFPEIRFVIPEVSGCHDVPSSESEAVRRESATLNNYFRAFSRLAGSSGADTGLTGGYDSRLILACSLKHFNKLQVHSHFRPAGSAEWRIASAIASGEGLPFISPEVRLPERMDDETLKNVICSSFRFNDGLISLHCNWMEEYNTFEYRLKVLGNNRLGLGGIGGEQYRNQDRLFIKPWLFSQWLKYSHVRKVSGNVFPGRKDEQELIERIGDKIYRVLDFKPGKRWIDLYDLRRIQNEVLIPAYRGARTDAENRHAWYLSPLADRMVALPAYGIIRFLKDSKKFETDLIKAIAPQLAAYPTDYGYNLVNGEPLFIRAYESAFENLLPASVKWTIRNSFKSGGRAFPFAGNIRKSNPVTGFIENVASLGLPVSIPALLRREGTAHMVAALGYAIEKMNITSSR